jgi:RND superfamily putative drug exporter
MATLLQRLGKTAYRRWPLFIAGWLALLVVVAGSAASFSQPFNDSFSIPGIPSAKADALQEQLFPGAQDAFSAADANVVVAAPKGHTLAEPRYDQPLADLVADLRSLPQLDPAANPGLGDPVDLAATQEAEAVDAARAAGDDVDRARSDFAAVSPLSSDGRAGVISFALDVESPAKIKPATIDRLTSAMDSARDAGLTVEANGAGSKVDAFGGGSAEAIGLAIALVILLLTFGSFVAAGLPIVTAILGVAIGLTGVTAMTAFMDLNSSTTALSSMIGLAVGIDYTLFILSRYRAELRLTDDRQEAIGIAAGTAGSAVVFAGLTVIIALSALSLVGISFLTSMGLAAAGTVLIAVLVALTLLPAILGMLKSKAFGGQVRKTQPRRDDAGRVLNNGVRWARLLGRRPAAAAILVVVVLGAIAAPVSGLHLAFPSDSTASSDTTQRKASDLMSQEFGPGREGPLLLVVDARKTGDPAAAIDQVTTWASEQDGVANAQTMATNADPSGPESAATGAIVSIQPTEGPDDAATKALLDDLREGQSAIERQSGTTIGVTGLTAITTDVSDKIAHALPVYLAVVIGLAFILLMLVFRSLLVPLTATLGFLLSVAATLGATVLIFQKGTFGLFEAQPIVSFMPIFLIGIVFGLAMDYQVFLVTRIREAHVHGMTPREAVVDGFRNSARVVTAAAAIMTAVFSGFILEADPIIKSLGFALATAVIFDAFIVRMMLIPAVMFLFGDKAWYLPTWLDRILPNVDVEGDNLVRTHPSVTTTDEPDEDRIEQLVR